MSNKVRTKLKIKLKTKEGGRVDLRGLPPPWKKKVGFEALARAKICMPARTQTQRLTGLNCLPLCVAVLGAPHVICDHAAAAAPLAVAYVLLLLYAVRITVIRRITGVHATGTVDPAMTREKEDHGHR